MKKTVLIIIAMWYLLSANTTFAFTHADTLRGSNGRSRSWWDVQKYDLKLHVRVDGAVEGFVMMVFRVTGVPTDSMQIDLQDSMWLYGVEGRIMKNGWSDYENVGKYVGNDNGDFSVRSNDLVREKDVYWLKHSFSKEFVSGDLVCIGFGFRGKPRKAVNPPWDGGISVKADSSGKPWLAVSCQGLGASAWWPCKDAQWDEPDSGMTISICPPEGLAAVSNGRLVKVDTESMIAHGTDGVCRRSNWVVWQWQVKNPINNYDVSFYIGDYVHWSDTIMGEKGKLDLDYWVLRENEQQARKQFAVTKQMLHCFEYWMGPYPFYEDGYKLVDAPYLGMEHQSAVAYGNGYQMGYLGYDRTGTGIGMNFDYIIIHESGHEWFGNNVTANDMADNWVHEGITTYSESLFEECLTGKEKGQAYCRGEWRNIRNDKPIIGPYGVNEEGSGDMYDKGAAIMYMIRQLTNDDEKFRQMLRGLGKEFYHQTVTTQQVETYIAAHTGLDLKAFFDQYLRTADIPVLEYSIKHKQLRYRFSNVVPGFTLPITAKAGKNTVTLQPTTEWQTMKWGKGYNIKFSKDFLIEVK
jgi:aminopeptidase N